MTRSITKLFAVALTLTTISLAGNVQAGGCHSGGGGYGGGFGGYSAPSFPSYRSTPSYQPSYSSRPRVIENRPAPQPQFQSREQFQGQQQAQQQQQPQQQPQQQAQTQAPTQNGLNALGGNQQQAQAPSQQQSAEMTALQALAGMGGEAQQQQPQPQAEPQQSQQPQASIGTAGTFVAQVGDKANVRLELQADGNFTWTATRDGKTSSFSGTYSTDGGKLTLTRNDSQSLAGAMTINSGGFNFKLDGATDNGLTFARA